MKLIISIAILLFVAPFSYSDTLTNYVNENGKTVWTNSGQGKSRGDHKSKNQIAITDEAIRQPTQEIPSNQARSLSFTTWVTHFMAHGEPRHRAIRLAEMQMIQKGHITSPRSVKTKKPERPKHRIATQKKHQKKAGTTRKKRKALHEPATALGDIQRLNREMQALTDFNRRATGMLDINSAVGIVDLQRHNRDGRELLQDRGTHATKPRSRRSKKTYCTDGGSGRSPGASGVGMVDNQAMTQNVRPGRRGKKSYNNINHLDRGHHSPPTMLLPNHYPAFINNGY